MENRLSEVLEYSKNRAAERGRQIYFIRCCEFVKIGIADSVPDRISNLQIACPFPLELLHHYEHKQAAWAESIMHLQYSALRERGEWYRLPQRTIDMLRAAGDRYRPRLAAVVRRAQGPRVVRKAMRPMVASPPRSKRLNYWDKQRDRWPDSVTFLTAPR